MAERARPALPYHDPPRNTRVPGPGSLGTLGSIVTDVRSPEYTDRAYDVMNQENLQRIIDDFAAVMETHPGF